MSNLIDNKKPTRKRQAKGRSITLTPSKNRKSQPVELSDRTQPALSRAEDILEGLKADQGYF